MNAHFLFSKHKRNVKMCVKQNSIVCFYMCSHEWVCVRVWQRRSNEHRCQRLWGQRWKGWYHIGLEADRFPFCPTDNKKTATAIYLSAFGHYSQSQTDLFWFFNVSWGSIVSLSVYGCYPSLPCTWPSLPPYPHRGGCQLSQQQLVPITRALTVRDGWPTTHTQIHTLLCTVIPLGGVKTNGIRTLQSKSHTMRVFRRILFLYMILYLQQ